MNIVPTMQNVSVNETYDNRYMYYTEYTNEYIDIQNGKYMKSILYKDNIQKENKTVLKEAAIIDCINILNDKLYYITNNANDLTTREIFSRELSDIENEQHEGTIYNIDLLSLDIEKGDKKIFSIGNDVYINLCEKVYLLRNGVANEVYSDISSVFIDNENIYYSTSNSEICKYNLTDKSSIKIISNDKMLQIDRRIAQMYGNEIEIENIIVNDDIMYFLIRSKNGLESCKIVAVNLSTMTGELVLKTKPYSTYYFDIYSDCIYFKDENTKNLVSVDIENGNITDIAENIYKFNIMNDTLYYYVYTENRCSFEYKDLK